MTEHVESSFNTVATNPNTLAQPSEIPPDVVLFKRPTITGTKHQPSTTCCYVLEQHPPQRRGERYYPLFATLSFADRDEKIFKVQSVVRRLSTSSNRIPVSTMTSART